MNGNDNISPNENGNINIYTAWAAHSQRVSATSLLGGQGVAWRGRGGVGTRLSRCPCLQVEENGITNISIGG